MDVATIQVAAVTSPDQWTLGAGASKVAAVLSPDDDDTSYITSTVINNEQRFSLASNPIPIGSTISQVRCFSRTKRGGSSNGAMRVGVFLGASSYYSEDSTAPSVYLSRQQIMTRPGGGHWTPIDFNALEVSTQLRSYTRLVRCTSLWLIVDYTPPANTGDFFKLF